jgi:DNA-binding transcriptional MerR regulator
MLQALRAATSICKSRLFDLKATFPHSWQSVRIRSGLCYLYSIIMSKQLSQTTFDFAAADESENSQITNAAIAINETATTEKKEIAEINKVAEDTHTIPAPSAAGKRGRRSLKEIDLKSDLIQIPDDEILFKKQYYSIGEVAKMFRENQSLIRYWETEFDILEPRKNRKGDRFFRPVDIKNLVLIYDLLRRRKFTIEGAKDYLKKNKKAEEKFALIQSLQKIKGFLLELKANL